MFLLPPDPWAPEASSPDSKRSRVSGIWRQLEDPIGIADSFEGLGQVASAEGVPLQVVRFFAAADRIRDSLSFSMMERTRRKRDHCLDEARGALGTAAFDVGWQAARDQSVESLMASVLGDPEAEPG